MMENKRELSMDVMDKVNGGVGSYQDCKFDELDGKAQKCIRNGYCPNCGPKQPIEKWKYFYRCYRCGLDVQSSD